MAALSVLHVAQPAVAGVPRIAADLVRDQTARGWRVAVACPAESELRSSAEDAGASAFRWEAQREPGPALLTEVRRLSRLIEAASPDVVHLHSSKAGLAGRLALRGRLPSVFQPNAWSFEAVGGILGRAAVRWERFATRWTDAIISVSDDERARAIEVGIRAHWVEIPNGIDLEALTAASDDDRRAARQRLGLEQGPLAVVAGRLCRQKGQDVLLRAWPQVRALAPTARLAVVGDGPDRARLEAHAPDGVLFAGHSAEVWTWLAAADVVVLPSRWEGLSLVLLEALACGRSVVATDVGGTRSTLAGGAGAVVPVGDEQTLAAAVAERLLDPALAAEEGRAGRRRVESAHDLRHVAALVAEVYRDVLERRGASRPEIDVSRLGTLSRRAPEGARS